MALTLAGDLKVLTAITGACNPLPGKAHPALAMLQDAWTLLGAVAANRANDPAVSCGGADIPNSYSAQRLQVVALVCSYPRLLHSLSLKGDLIFHPLRATGGLRSWTTVQVLLRVVDGIHRGSIRRTSSS
jgi:hypothetical protein